MKSKTLFLSAVIIGLTYMAVYGQSQYDDIYDLTVSTPTRDAKAVLYVKNGSGNTFTGLMIWDQYEREVFGWYVEKISEGDGFIYNTKSIVFYAKLNAEFQHQQLFKAIYNFDGTYISGTYFYWGNEFNFYGYKTGFTDEPVNPDPIDPNPDTPNTQITIIVENNIGDLITISPNPADNTITISSLVVLLNYLYCELYSESGVLIKRFDLFSNSTQLDLSDIPNGNYIIKLFTNKGQELGTVKIIKNY